jgi:asparagine synthase (glutamine-hydrolysing)
MVNTHGTHLSQELIQNVAQKLQHRGPDNLGLYQDKNVLMLHTRLRINGDMSSQPLTNNDNTIHLIINGEIFNWKELSNELNYTCTKSDCEVIIPLYQKYKHDIGGMLRRLEGQFSFVLYDTEINYVLIARDRIGITPLYIGKDGGVVIASELKCLEVCGSGSVDVFNPRTYIYGDVSKIATLQGVKFHSFDDHITTAVYDPSDRPHILANIRNYLKASVKSQLEDLLIDGAANFGVLLSGGLDSSLIASLVVGLCKELGFNKQVKTFSIGVHKDVPDLVAARRVAKYLGTDHHEFYFETSEGVDAIPQVIWHIESYDCTSVRASTAMYLLTKKIKEKFNDTKVLFSGELSDELLCYLYGANAPSEEAFQNETIALVSNVHLFDCLRANKTCMAHSMEARVPFTDSKFVDYILGLHPKWKCFGSNGVKGAMEKQILRDAFVGWLPDDILYRKKEQFSDGVSGFNGPKDNLIDALKHYCTTLYSKQTFENECTKYPFNKPTSHETLYYRSVFDKHFGHIPNSEFTVKTWQPKWCANSDPSGRVQSFWEIN